MITTLISITYSFFFQALFYLIFWWPKITPMLLALASKWNMTFRSMLLHLRFIVSPYIIINKWWKPRNMSSLWCILTSDNASSVHMFGKANTNAWHKVKKLKKNIYIRIYKIYSSIITKCFASFSTKKKKKKKLVPSCCSWSTPSTLFWGI